MVKKNQTKPYINRGTPTPDPSKPGKFRILPPPRPQPIPVCWGDSGTGVMQFSFGGSASPTWQRWDSNSSTVSQPTIDKAESSDEKETPVGSSTQLPSSSLIVNDYFRPIPRQNFALAGGSKTDSKVGKAGVRVTEIGGWEEEAMEPITVVRLKPIKRNSYHPRYALKRNRMYLIRVNRVTDPSNFFMEFIIDPPKDGCATWEESLDKFYSDPEISEKYKMSTIQPIIGQQYAIYNEEGKKWERVRVHDVIRDEKLVAVLFMERLSYDYIPITSLFELHARFANWHRVPMNGGLRDIVPRYDPSLDLSLEEANDLPWTPEAIKFFEEYTEGKIFRALVITREFDMNDNLKHVSEETRFAKLTVILFEEGADHDIPVNAMMVEKGYASANRGMTAWKNLLDCFHGTEAAGN